MTDIRKQEATVRGKAVFSPDHHYRYSMYRSWGEGAYGSKEWYERTLCFVLGNPSYADALIYDTTTMKCLQIAADPTIDCDDMKSDCDGMIIFNLVAEVTRHSGELTSEPDPVGPENEHFLTEAAKYKTIVVGWGSIEGTKISGIKKQQIRLFHDLLKGKRIYSLSDSSQDGPNAADGMPWHLSRINLSEQVSVEMEPWSFPANY